MKFSQHIILSTATIKEALGRLDQLAQDAILFVVDEKNILLGSVTDGDIRRGFINGISVNEKVLLVAQKEPKYILKDSDEVSKLKEYRNKNLRIIPVVDPESKKICDLINFRLQTTKLPIDAVIMAGGEGRRLRPLTENTPKPLLKVGNKPILAHNLDRLDSFGVNNIWLSVNYLAEQMEKFVAEHPKKESIQLVYESHPLGTIGSVSLIDHFEHETILVSNSDLLTNVDYEAFYEDFKSSGAVMSVLSIPYKVDIPYAVLELANGLITSLKEKPTYTYYSNGGIYLIQRSALDNIPKNAFFNAPDLIEILIQKGKKIRSFPHHGYWLDIGKHDDFKQAQEDINVYEW